MTCVKINLRASARDKLKNHHNMRMRQGKSALPLVPFCVSCIRVYADRLDGDGL